MVTFDGFVKNPISALRFIPLSLRRTARTPHSMGFARLELGPLTKPSIVMAFYESITLPTAWRSMQYSMTGLRTATVFKYPRGSFRAEAGFRRT
jgi:hypothetical protein